ncbi:MAG TPA: FHA domain-containing protein [Ktedonobacterales bacterium]
MNLENGDFLLIMSIDGTFLPRRIALSWQSFSIGRDRSNEIPLDDNSVSRRHIHFEKLANGWHVERLPGSSTLYVNGRLTDKALVGDGDQLVIGGVATRLELADEQGAGGEKADVRTIQAQPPAPQLSVEWPGGRFIAPLRNTEYVIGRAPDCALIVPSPLVSSHHATLRRGQHGVWLIADANSQNGLLVNGHSVRSTTLNVGDAVTIGSRASGQYVSMRLVPPAQSALATPGVVTPSVGEMTMGRDAASTFCLPNAQVSRHHARLRRAMGGAVVIEDLNSTNGTYVNYQRIRQPTQLKLSDYITIGPYAFIFDGTSLGPAGRDGAIRLDALDLVRTAQRGKAVLLDHVTLTVMPGEFVAIAGGNGTGKTTVLKALAGIQPAQHGHVLFNGVDSYANYEALRGQIGYVPQSDIVHGALTVERALYFAARLRLASDMRDDEVQRRISDVLDAVDLKAHRYKTVEKLSGGERKRVSLAVELLAEPPILFLDEPNAPLDPGHRGELLQTIRSLATKGHTIVMVSHFLEDLQACDRIAMMGHGGRLCYFGPPAGAMSFFTVGSIAEIYGQLEGASQAEQWRQRFMRSAIYERDVRARLPQFSGQTADGTLPPSQRGWGPSARGRGISAPRQLALLVQRYLEIMLHDRLTIAILLLQAPLIGFILAALSQSGVFTRENGPLDAQKVLFVVAIVAIWFGTSNAIREIAKESDIYQRERLAGLAVTPYVLSKVVVLGLLCVIQTAVLLVIVTAKTGSPPDSAGLILRPTLELFVGALLAGLAGLALGLCVSAFASNSDKAIAAAPLVLLPQILLAGVIFPVSGPIGGVASLTASRWAVEALGTSADLNHLYYAQITARATGTTPVISTTQAQTHSAGSGSTYDPGDYDSHPTAANYTTSAAPGSSWADAHDGRLSHLLLTWGALVGLFALFLVIAIARQRTKDP